MNLEVHYAVASPEGELRTQLTVPTRCGKPVMMHDIAITEHFSILLEFPLCFEMSRIEAGMMPYEMDLSQPSRFGVLPRHASAVDQIQWFEGKRMMCFHIANAWEDGPLIQLIGTPNPNFDFEFAKSAASVLYHWTFDLRSGELEERFLDPCMTRLEFPVITPKLTGLPVRYIYAAKFVSPNPQSTEQYSPFHAICGVCKYDHATGSLSTHTFVGGRWGGESVFVPRVGSDGEEDAGYLVTFTFNPKVKCSELYIVDAATMADEPVAILETPYRVPFGFHGLWIERA